MAGGLRKPLQQDLVWGTTRYAQLIHPCLASPLLCWDALTDMIGNRIIGKT
jgi:hypothetical protein